MITDWLSGLQADLGSFNISDFLNQLPYDELVEFDLINNHCRNLVHTEGKYFVPFKDGSIDALHRFVPENMVHPADRDIQIALMDPADMPERLKAAPIPGLLEAEVRFKLLDGGWCWTRELLVSGEQNGLPEGIVHMYVMDIQRGRDDLPGKDRALTDFHPDELTGLPMDRDLFPMARARLREAGVAPWCVIAIDIEHFKLFVNWHGKLAGDMLLTEISKVLRRVETDTNGLAGYHGLDNFWLVMPYVQTVINALYEELRTLIAGRSNTMGFLPIFGISIVTDPEEDIADTFNHAAMTAEQTRGDLHNRIRVYNPAIYNKTVEEYRMLSDFQHGLENHEVFFCLQPQCKIANGRIIGAESLARWRRADGQMVPPGIFVPVLEKYGMVTNLDRFIWEEVFKWLHDWTAKGHIAVPISMNISQIDILTIDVPAFFGALLEKYALPPGLIKVEITESAYVSDTAVVRDTVRRLREQGFLVLMDDFGSGYSSLNMLRSLNVDVIKLDAQFLRIQNQEERKGISILESVINMTKSMHMPIIVEGVETQEQINFLADLGCRYMQGYYFHRPMPVAEFEKMLLDKNNIDTHGIEFKGNEQMHPREFLDENVFTDAMLNNILGAVAIYCWKGTAVDIERYNQQFYQMVGIPLRQLNARRIGIENFLYPEDVPVLYALLDTAARDHMNGAKGIVRVYRPNNTLRWISLRLYFLNEDDKGKHFYGSSEDVTELQYINTEIPGGYFRVASDGSCRIEFMSQIFLDMVGYTAQEIKRQFGNRLTDLIYEEDRQTLIDRMNSFTSGHKNIPQTYRMRHKTKGYIYVMVQSLLRELSGDTSFISIATDVTEVMSMRNSMRLLSGYLADTIVFLGHEPDGWKHHVVIHGLEERMGLNTRELEDAFNSYQFYTWVRTDDAPRLTAAIYACLEKNEPFDTECDMSFPNGREIRIHVRMDTVRESSSSIRYICVIREAR